MRIISAYLTWTVLVIMIPQVAAGSSPWERHSTSAPRVGLIIGDGGSSVQEEARQVESELTSNGLVLVRWQPTENGIVDEGKGESVERLKAEGEQLYFFEGARQAQEHLDLPVRRSMEVSQLWMADGETSGQLFDAAIFLVRSHLDQGQEQQAVRLMEQLVEALPAHQPDERIVPPPVIELWEEVRGKQGKRGATLDIGAWIESEECELQVNGGALASTPLAVAPDRSYLVEGSCEKGESTRWWLTVGPGEQIEIPRFNETFDADEFAEMVRRWALPHRLDGLVYLGPGDCGSSEDVPCLAVFGEGKITMQPYDEDLLAVMISSLE